MAGSVVFEITFKTKSDEADRENLFVTIDEESMTSYTMLRENLSKCIPEPFALRYMDDEDDIVSIDTDEEFKEFVKFAQVHSSKGMLIKLIVEEGEPKVVPKETPMEEEKSSNQEMPEIIVEKMKKQIKKELKRELLSEMNICPNGPDVDQTNGYIDFEEDSDGNVVLICEKRKKKLIHKQRKMEKKDKHDESKFDKRLEKLELKKKRLLEKAEQRLKVATSKKVWFDPGVALPWIMSAVASDKPSVLIEEVEAGTTFYHVWHITNDGTVPLNNVILRHYWSSPGLKPIELSAKCPFLVPGKDGIITVGFKAPDEVVAFTSYWHFFYELSGKWVQFGHYVLLKGNVKPIKNVSSEEKEVTGEGKKINEDKKTVTFADEADKKKETQMCIDSMRLPCQVQMEVQRKLEATLASSVIAAEMAREAANVAYRRAVECRCSQQANAESVVSATNAMEECIEKAADSIEKLNISSGSDTDTNIDSNEDTDRGFVLVDVPSCYRDDGSEAAVKDLSGKGSNVESNDDNDRDAKDNNLKSFPGDDRRIEDSSKNNFDTAMKVDKINEKDNPSVEQLGAAGNNNQVFGPYSSISRTYQSPTNLSKVQQYLSQRGPPYHLPNPSPFAYAPSQPYNLYQSKMNGYSPSSVPFYHLPVTSQPLPYTFGQPPCNPDPFVASHILNTQPVVVQKNPSIPCPSINPYQIMNACPTSSGTTMRHPFINLPMNGPDNAGATSVSKNQAPEIGSAEAVNQPAEGNPTPKSIATTQVGDHSRTDYLNTTPLTSCAVLPTPLAPTQVNPPVYPVTPMNNVRFANFNTMNKTYETAKSPFTHNVGCDFSSKRPVLVEVYPDKLKKAPYTPNSIPNSSNIQGNVMDGHAKWHFDQNNSAPKPVKEPGVQILPQALVDGAINVASSAYSTACNALTHLRSKGDSVEFDPVFENNMALLVEMGFNNLERNARLLKRFNNDVNQVIGAICASGGGDLLLD